MVIVKVGQLGHALFLSSIVSIDHLDCEFGIKCFYLRSTDRQENGDNDTTTQVHSTVMLFCTQFLEIIFQAKAQMTTSIGKKIMVAAEKIKTNSNRNLLQN